MKVKKGGRKKLLKLIQWIDSIEWLGYAETDRKVFNGIKNDESDIVYTLACYGRVDFPLELSHFSFSDETPENTIDTHTNILSSVASIGPDDLKLTNIQFRFIGDKDVIKFFSPLIERIHKIVKLSPDDKRLKVCDIVAENNVRMIKKYNIDIFDIPHKGTIYCVDLPEQRN